MYITFKNIPGLRTVSNYNRINYILLFIYLIIFYFVWPHTVLHTLRDRQREPEPS